MKNKLDKFIEVLSSVGGKAFLVGDKDINDIISRIRSDVFLDPDDSYGNPVTVVEGKLAVAENGCVWIPYEQENRSMMFLAEHLIIVVEAQNIVADMHEAYDLISSEDYLYGCFMSGPSKTADIAQALVMGAQAAVGLTVLIRK